MEKFHLASSLNFILTIVNSRCAKWDHFYLKVTFEIVDNDTGQCTHLAFIVSLVHFLVSSNEMLLNFVRRKILHLLENRRG